MEGLASAILKPAVAKLASVIGDQLMMQWNLRDDLEDMKDKLDMIGATLEDAERRSIKEKQVQVWLKRLKNAAYDISDMLDDFQDGKRTGLLSYFAIAQNITLAHKMKNMRQELRKIQKDHEDFQFLRDSGSNSEEQISDRRETTSAVNEETTLGREEEKKEIIELLPERNTKEGSTIIVPINGLGGIGKTTLARLVFNDTHFKQYDHRAWVYVSQVFDLKKIGRSIISRVSKQGNQDLNDQESINQRLKEIFNGKKILIVLDDLWEENNTELKKLQTMLNVGNEGSKIDVIVTTRKEEIAKKIRTGKSYDLKPLDDTMCWNIIRKRCNFESRHDKEQLEQIGQDIARKCAGIALAAQALGYTLSEMDLEGWSAVRDSDIWNEPSLEDIHSVLPSLMLSYKRMPSYLKLCFAYCAIFPKGQNIGKYDLVYQWIALDFIKPSTETFSATQLGEKYVTQLLGMSFLHHSNLSSGMSFLRHSNLSSTSQGPEVCFTMHDLVHDLARSVMTDELLLSDAEKGSNSSRNKYCRYALLTNYSGPTKLSAIIPAQVRALRFLDCWERELRDDAFKFAKYLRVLDLSGCELSKLPECVTPLSRLQCLNLHGSSGISRLPESIGKIEGLMCLDLSGCHSLVELPESIGKIEHMMHLDLSDCSRLVQLPESLGNLKNLVHLSLSVCFRVEGLPKAFCSLTKLQYLNISHCSTLEELPEDIGSLTELRHLNLSTCYKNDVLPESFGKLQNLVHLDLSGNRALNYLPESLGNLKRLHTLDLTGCSNQLEEHMMYSGILSKFVQSARFMVHANDVNTGGNLHLLEYMNPAELEICSLENVRFPEEARTVKLFEKQNLWKLIFDWALDACRFSEDKEVLEELVPPSGLEYLELRGYSSIELPTWLMGIMSSPPYLDASHHLPNVVEITLENLPRCNNLPPLGQLPNLAKLRLIRLCSITNIGEDLCGGDGAFRRLSEFKLKDMERLVEWSTTYSGNDGMKFMFPKLETLDISNCGSLRLKPCPPIFSRWYIISSDKVISSWSEGDHISISSCTPATILNVYSSKLPKDKWRLLHHIPAIQEFEIRDCDYLTSLPESIRHLTSLRSLELTYCDSISVLPEWMGDLTSLEMLKISFCQSMKSLPQCVRQLTMLKWLHIEGNYELKKWCESKENKIKFAQITDMRYWDCDSGDSQNKNNSVSLHLVMVSDVITCSKLHQLEEVNLNELKISCLEDVSSLEEAHKVRLLDRQSLSQLKLEWTSDDDRFLDDKDVLGELVPPRGLQYLKLDGYSSISFPTWLMGISHYLPSLAKINLKNLPRCRFLPPLGQLPNLDELHLERLHGITKIDGDFCGGKGAFLQLSKFTLSHMEQLEEWNTTYCRGDGVDEFMFPKLDKLEIRFCPKLRLTPCPPIFHEWKIWNSDEVISSWSEGECISHSPSDTRGATLDVLYSKVPMDKWRLLHHLPTLNLLGLLHCGYLASLPESVCHLVSLEYLDLVHCNGISELPEWLGDLPSLVSLYINKCRSIKSLPQCIQQLTKLEDLYILENPKLKRWCESNENKMKLAHIENIREYGNYVAMSPIPIAFSAINRSKKPEIIFSLLAPSAQDVGMPFRLPGTWTVIFSKESRTPALLRKRPSSWMSS